MLYGVYDLLEELGCRFFGASSDDEVPTLAGAPFWRADERFEQATFPFRERHFLEPVRTPAGAIDVAVARREIDHAAKRRMNGFSFHIEDFAPEPADWRVVLEDWCPEVARRGLMPGLGEHGGYPLWLPAERYTAEHPDWYAEIDGRRVGGFRGQGRYQFCTEHPEACATFLDNMVEFLRVNPAIQIMHIAPEDVGRWCECARCAPIPIADRYLRVDNAIAERIHAVRPDVWVTHLVYANHAELPSAEPVLAGAERLVRAVRARLHPPVRRPAREHALLGPPLVARADRGLGAALPPDRGRLRRAQQGVPQPLADLPAAAAAARRGRPALVADARRRRLQRAAGGRGLVGQAPQRLRPARG